MPIDFQNNLIHQQVVAKEKNAKRKYSGSEMLTSVDIIMTII